MMTKQDYINYWVKSGEERWDAAIWLMNGGKNVEALFLFCLAIEKYLKVNWVKHYLNRFPPKLHNLHTICSQTDVELSPEHIDFLDTINRWNIEGRYPDSSLAFISSLHRPTFKINF